MSYYRFILTIPRTEYSVDELKSKFKTHCKKWAFQVEKGENTGYEHYQCFISLHRKRRIPEVQKLFKGHVTIISSTEDSESYCMKEDTRIDGPWSFDTEPVYIPSNLRISEWNPFQKLVLDKAKDLTYRQMLFVIDPKGNRGKSTLANALSVKNEAVRMPSTLTSANDMLRWALCVLGKARTRKLCFIDLPRTHEATNWGKFLMALEEISNGYAYDERYAFKQAWFEPPKIVVFCNSIPEGLDRMLTGDRIIKFPIPEIF